MPNLCTEFQEHQLMNKQWTNKVLTFTADHCMPELCQEYIGELCVIGADHWWHELCPVTDEDCVWSVSTLSHTLVFCVNGHCFHADHCLSLVSHISPNLKRYLGIVVMGSFCVLDEALSEVKCSVSINCDVVSVVVMCWLLQSRQWFDPGDSLDVKSAVPLCRLLRPSS